MPCKDIKLTGITYTTPSPLTPNKDDKATTGAFVPFGTEVLYMKFCDQCHPVQE